MARSGKNFSLYRGIWLVPLAALVAGSIVLVGGWWERQRNQAQLRQFFDNHVRAYESLIYESARGAAAGTALAYDLVSEELRAAGERMLAEGACNSEWPAPDDASGGDVGIIINKDGRATGKWGDVGAARRSDFVRRVLSSPDELVDWEVAGGGRLLCLAVSDMSTTAVSCQPADAIAELESETGMARLLRNIIKFDIVYVALQDPSSVLAVAPSPDVLTEWKTDPALADAMSRTDGGSLTRLRKVGGVPVYEGLKPFPMADGSVVLLRVGIRGAVLEAFAAASMRRFQMMASMAGVIVALALLLAVVMHASGRRQEKAARILAEREEERRHWETIGQMASTVAHEVRNPLNTIGMVAQRMQREFSVPPAERPDFDGMLETLRNESTRVNRVVTGFLELGRPMVMNPVDVEAAGYFQSVAAPHRVRAAAEAKDFEVDNALAGTIRIDPDRMAQVCGNLIGNALDAVPSGGMVRLGASMADGYLVVTVSDNGPGMDSRTVEEVMKPFVSMKSTGTGLGLPLVNRLVRAMGGTFELQSEPGRGTVARITLPAGPGI